MRAERSEASKYSDARFLQNVARFLQNVAISAPHRTLPFPFPLQFRDRHSFFARKREIETSPGSLCGFHRVRLAVYNPFPMPSLHHALSRKMLMLMVYETNIEPTRPTTDSVLNEYHQLKWFKDGKARRKYLGFIDINTLSSVSNGRKTQTLCQLDQPVRGQRV